MARRRTRLALDRRRRRPRARRRPHPGGHRRNDRALLDPAVLDAPGGAAGQSSGRHPRETRMRLRTLIPAATLAAALAVNAPAHAGGTLTIAQSQDPNNWDPIATFLISWGQVGSNLYDGLVMRDEE